MFGFHVHNPNDAVWSAWKLLHPKYSLSPAPEPLVVELILSPCIIAIQTSWSTTKISGSKLSSLWVWRRTSAMLPSCLARWWPCIFHGWLPPFLGLQAPVSVLHPCCMGHVNCHHPLRSRRAPFYRSLSSWKHGGVLPTTVHLSLCSPCTSIHSPQHHVCTPLP